MEKPVVCHILFISGRAEAKVSKDTKKKKAPKVDLEPMLYNAAFAFVS